LAGGNSEQAGTDDVLLCVVCASAE
jgi:hypothetical protein